MGSYKRYKRRQRPAKKRQSWSSWFRKNTTPGGIASAVYNADADTIWRQIYRIKGLVNSEIFKYDQSNAAVNVTNGGGALQLTTIAQGDGIAARTGNSIYVRSVNIKGNLVWNQLAPAGQSVRLVLVLDTQQVGDTAPTAGDVFTTTNSYGHLNPATVGRYKILCSRVYQLYPNKPQAQFEINKAMRHHVRYNGTASTDIQRGGLYFMYMSDSASTYPTLNFEARLSYHDN